MFWLTKNGVKALAVCCRNQSLTNSLVFSYLSIDISPFLPLHDDVIKWNLSPRYWPIVRGIHRSPVNSPHKGQWRWVMISSLIWVIVNSNFRNKLQWNLKRNSCIFIQESACENLVCKKWRQFCLGLNVLKVSYSYTFNLNFIRLITFSDAHNTAHVFIEMVNVVTKYSIELWWNINNPPPERIVRNARIPL